MSMVKVHLVIPHRDQDLRRNSESPYYLYSWYLEYGRHPAKLCYLMHNIIDQKQSFRAVTFSEALVDYLGFLVGCNLVTPADARITVFDKVENAFVPRDLTIDKEGIIHGWPPGYLAAW